MGINRRGDLSCWLTCQCGFDWPLRLFKVLGAHTTWSPKFCPGLSLPL